MEYLKDYDKFLNESKEHPMSNKMREKLSELKDTINKAVKLLTGDEIIGGTIFLLEIAMVETKLGTDPNTYRTSGNAGRGVWQIDEVGFNSTKDTASHPNLKKFHERLKSRGIDWSKMTWNDCNKDLIGAIAARLILLNKPFKISEYRKERAKQWKKYYNSELGKGTEEKYLESISLCKAILAGKNVA